MDQAYKPQSAAKLVPLAICTPEKQHVRMTYSMSHSIASVCRMLDSSQASDSASGPRCSPRCSGRRHLAPWSFVRWNGAVIVNAIIPVALEVRGKRSGVRVALTHVDACCTSSSPSFLPFLVFAAHSSFPASPSPVCRALAVY